MQFTRHPHLHPAFLCTVAATVFTLATGVQAEEKSMWQKFKDFFSPVPTVVGEGPEYDELRDLDQQINKLEGRYSRERRANNKRNIRKQIDELKLKRENLAKKIEEKEKAEAQKPKTAQPKSSASATAAPAACNRDTLVVHDTLLVHDTVTVHDTLYVIVSDKPAAAPAAQPAQPAKDSAATDTTTATQSTEPSSK